MTSFEFFGDEFFDSEFFDNIVSGRARPKIVLDGTPYICTESGEQKLFIANPDALRPTVERRAGIAEDGPGALSFDKRVYRTSDHRECRAKH
jgi:hypothetical protein